MSSLLLAPKGTYPIPMTIDRTVDESQKTDFDLGLRGGRVSRRSATQDSQSEESRGSLLDSIPEFGSQRFTFPIPTTKLKGTPSVTDSSPGRIRRPNQATAPIRPGAESAVLRGVHSQSAQSRRGREEAVIARGSRHSAHPIPRRARRNPLSHGDRNGRPERAPRGTPARAIGTEGRGAPEAVTGYFPPPVLWRGHRVVCLIVSMSYVY